MIPLDYPTHSLFKGDYFLDAELHYHPESGGQPFTIQNGGLPSCGFLDDEINLFYNADANSVANGIAVEHVLPDKNIDDDPVPVCAENEFSTYGPVGDYYPQLTRGLLNLAVHYIVVVVSPPLPNPNQPSLSPSHNAIMLITALCGFLPAVPEVRPRLFALDDEVVLSCRDFQAY
ncbi:hypothetical protein MMC16_007409 [Acarospora aff. strigata]|nr:hypothetical protein [Acarospora aff. strigata]